jgi:hypothetical protein
MQYESGRALDRANELATAKYISVVLNVSCRFSVISQQPPQASPTEKCEIFDRNVNEFLSRDPPPPIRRLLCVYNLIHSWF